MLPSAASRGSDIGTNPEIQIPKLQTNPNPQNVRKLAVRLGHLDFEVVSDFGPSRTGTFEFRICEARAAPYAATAFRGASFFGFLAANSKPTLPFSNLRCAEKGRPFLEINFGKRSVLPVAISFWTCSFGISRCKIVLLIRKVQV